MDALFNSINENMEGDGFSYEGSEDELSQYKTQIENEFMKSLERGDDISIYLYLPHFYISENVKKHLDIYLLKIAYTNLFEREDATDVIYEDQNLTITIRDEKFKNDMLNQMLDYFTKNEEYEKCAKVSEELKRMKNSKQ